MLARTIRSSLHGVKPKQNGIKVVHLTNNNKYSYGHLYRYGVKDYGFVGAIVRVLLVHDMQPKIINTICGMSIRLIIGAISPYLIDKVMDSQSSA